MDIWPSKKNFVDVKFYKDLSVLNLTMIKEYELKDVDKSYTIYANNADNVIKAGNKDDIIYTFNGDDTVYAGDGDVKLANEKDLGLYSKVV